MKNNSLHEMRTRGHAHLVHINAPLTCMHSTPPRNTEMARVVLAAAFIVIAGCCFSVCFGQGDLVIYKLNQATCTQYQVGPTYDCRWPANLNGAIDYQVLKGKIVAYKIQWSNGAWTDWFVPGYNDVDYKFNPAAMSCSVPYEANSMRRMWSYFYDHTHLYIHCQ